MKDFKSQVKKQLFLELHMTISKLLIKDEINKANAIKAGSFVSAQFIENIHQQNFKKGKGPLPKEELEAIFENVGDFYLQSFKGQFTQSDAETIMKIAMNIVMALDTEEIISDYFQKLKKV